MADPQPADDLSTVMAPYLLLLGALRRGTPVDADRTSLVEAAAEVWSRPGFDIFLSQPRLEFEPFDYQWQTAQRRGDLDRAGDLVSTVLQELPGHQEAPAFAAETGAAPARDQR